MLPLGEMGRRPEGVILVSASAARPRRLAVVGAGWAGLATAVRGTEAGWQVTLFDMAPQPGGRARAVPRDEGLELDNGQHILIGAYRETLALMCSVGADPERLLHRRPLALVDPRGVGLTLPPGPAAGAFVRAVLARPGWSWRERLALLGMALRWRLGGFRADPSASVAALTASLPARVRDGLIDPLCVAALNTPSAQASAQVFLRVLREALFSGPGAADLLLPRATLSALLPRPAQTWLEARGATLRWRSRVQSLGKVDDGAADAAWLVDGETFDAVVLACGANESARLVRELAPAWAAVAAAFEVQPIVTVYLRSPGSRLAAPMVALAADDKRPAQFAFDLGAIDPVGGRDGVFAFVVSGAREWVERGLEACEHATLEQASTQFPAGTWAAPPTVLRTIAERRATFACTPGLRRPAAFIAPGLAAAGDHVEGPYPATLEGAVRSALSALDSLNLALR
jgi:hydroxysqualene dehydroxylase